MRKGFFPWINMRDLTSGGHRRSRSLAWLLPVVWPFLLTVPPSLAQSPLGVSIEPAFPALTFERPTDLQNAGDGSDRLFVVEQRTGLIKVFVNDPSVTTAKTFLDIRDKLDATRSETGLLGLAFHPNYEENGYFFVNYVTPEPRKTVVARYKVSSGDEDAADTDSVRIILEIGQPDSNHNGGQLAFGPDGYLYIGMGDGGDEPTTAQDLTSLLGSMLRIDVDHVTDNSTDYLIPPDNPLVDNTSGYREEAWAWGFRNPWRFSFDPSDNLWVADVGQHDWEEVNVVEKGKNYGWPNLEGLQCYLPVTGCEVESLVPPVLEYGHGEGNSITGGRVYTGERAPALDGRYLYADFGSGRIWAAANDGGSWSTELVEDTEYDFSTFGVDESGEVYVVSLAGTIYRFKALSTTTEPESAHLGDFFAGEPYPNPTARRMTVPMVVSKSVQARVSVHDLLGRELAVVFSGTLTAGEHHVSFDMPDVAGSGRLWIGISADETRTWRQVVLVR